MTFLGPKKQLHRAQKANEGPKNGSNETDNVLKKETVYSIVVCTVLEQIPDGNKNFELFSNIIYLIPAPNKAHQGRKVAKKSKRR